MLSFLLHMSTTWDGTLSANDFYITATALSEKWKVINSAFPPWTWVPCPRPFGVALHQAQGYLSLENFCCSRSIEGDIGDGSSRKEEPTCSGKEEPTDDASLVHSYDQNLHFYDFHIVHSTSYRVPVLYFRGYNSDGQPLALDDIEKDLPYHSLKLLKDSRWTFMTQEEHPYLNRPWYALHPCGTSEWMRLLFIDDASGTEDRAVIQQYLVSWLSVVGQVVGLRIPLKILNESYL